MAGSLSATTSFGVAAAANKPHLQPQPAPPIARAPRRLSQCPQLTLHAKSISEHSTPKWLVTPRAISGSTGVETSSTIESSPVSLDNVIVYDLKGNGIPISDLWKDRKAVVAFARHFGCVLCRTRASYLEAEKDKMDAAGVVLILIGPGSVDQAKTFSEQTKFKGEVYADPSHSSYKALSFVSGVSTTFTPGAGLKIIQAYLEGYRQDWALSFEKDTRTRGGWQQGGIIIAGPGKDKISYVHKDKEAGDDPNIQDILKACCEQGT